MHFNSETASCTPPMLIIDENDNSPGNFPQFFFFQIQFSLPLFEKTFDEIEPRRPLSRKNQPRGKRL